VQHVSYLSSTGKLVSTLDHQSRRVEDKAAHHVSRTAALRMGTGTTVGADVVNSGRGTIIHVGIGATHRSVRHSRRCVTRSAQEDAIALAEVCDLARSAWTSGFSTQQFTVDATGRSRWPREFRSIEGDRLKALAAALLVFVAACARESDLQRGRPQLHGGDRRIRFGMSSSGRVGFPSRRSSGSCCLGIRGVHCRLRENHEGNANLVTPAVRERSACALYFAAGFGRNDHGDSALNIPVTAVTGARCFPWRSAGGLSSVRYVFVLVKVTRV